MYVVLNHGRHEYGDSRRTYHKNRDDEADGDIVGDLLVESPLAADIPDGVKGVFDVGEEGNDGPEEEEDADADENALSGFGEI